MHPPPQPTNEPSGWAAVQEIGQVLRPVWLTAGLSAGAAALLQVSQARDALVAVAETGFASGTQRSLLLAVVIFGLSSWATARVLLGVRYWFTPEEQPHFDRWRLWVPRALGALPPTAVAAGSLRSCLPPFGREDAGVGERLGLGLFYLAVAAVLLLLFHLRRRWWLRRRPLEPPAEEMPRLSRRVAGGILAVSFLLLALFLVSKVTWPQRIGPLAIVLYALAAWSACGSLVLVYPSYRRRWPPLWLGALLLAALFSLSNDNHGIRPGSTESGSWLRPAAGRFFREQWFPPRWESWSRRFPGAPYPVVLVSAEGGGIRAAYWTAAVLAKLEDEIPDFGCHVFALSGVSGGSLGSAVYAALLADRLTAGESVCAGDAGDAGDPRLRRAAAEILGRDFLAPALAGMLFPDFVQRFLPVSLLPDRALYLERSWEQGWRRWRGHGPPGDRFAADFRNLWRGDRGQGLEVPSLFLNATWVRGGRLVASNLSLDPAFVEVDDVVEMLGRPLPLSAAVGLSARFPYVSPAASLEVDGELRGIVDGGYFENSGALTAAEILASLAAAADEAPDPLADRILPVVLIVTNGGRKTAALPRFLGEALAPAVAFFNTRLTRGFLAEEQLESQAGERVPVVELRLTAELPNLRAPLGWVLSERTREAIDRRLDDGAWPPAQRLERCLGGGACGFP